MAVEENKVTLVGVNSASVMFSNDANAEKQYKVKANVNVSDGTNINSFDSGVVKSLESEKWNSPEALEIPKEEFISLIATNLVDE